MDALDTRRPPPPRFVVFLAFAERRRPPPEAAARRPPPEAAVTAVAPPRFWRLLRLQEEDGVFLLGFFTPPANAVGGARWRLRGELFRSNIFGAESRTGD